MRPLAALLAGRLAPAVYRWERAWPAARIRVDAERAGWRPAYVDGRDADDKAAFLDELAEALDFPDWFGGNFDALADCLRDLTSAGGVLLVWESWSTLAEQDPGSFAIAVEVLGERAADPAADPFAVLLCGEGPPVGVPDLDG